MLQASIDELRRENERLRGLVGDGGASGEGRGAEEGIGSSNTTVVTATAAGIGAEDETNVAIPEKSSRLIPVGDVGSSLDGPVGGTCTGTESPAGPEPTLLQSSKVSLLLFGYVTRLVYLLSIVFARLDRKST